MTTSVISDIGHAWIQHAIKLVRNRKYRLNQGSMILSGHKIISEFTGPPPYSLAATPTFARSGKITNCFTTKTQLISEALVKAVTREANPEGVIAEVKMPAVVRICEDGRSAPAEVTNDGRCLKRILVLFRTKDPGNLGTLLRTAYAFNWDGVVLVDNCVDPFNLECIRASKGASLKIKLFTCGSEALKSFLERHRLLCVIAEKSTRPFQISVGNCVLSAGTDLNSSESPSTGHVSFGDKAGLALIMGSESSGFQDFPKDLLNSSFSASIKMATDMESLNLGVSGGILLNLFQEGSLQSRQLSITNTQLPIFQDLFKLF